MKILQLIQREGIGIEPVLNDDANAIKALGYNLNSSFLEKERVLNEREDFSHQSRLKQFIETESPDIIHLHLFRSLRYPKLVRRLAQRWIVVTTAHDHVLTCPTVRRLGKNELTGRPWTCQSRPGLSCLLNPYLHGCSRRWPPGMMHAIYEYLQLRLAAKKMAQFIVLSPYMVSTLHNAGFGEEQVNLVPPSWSYLLKQGASDSVVLSDRNIILFVGRMHPEKGVHLLIRASARIKVPHEIWLAGAGPFEPFFRSLADDLGVSNRLHWLGHMKRDEIMDLYLKAKIIVVPSSLPEPFGLTGLEAMYSGRPVVAFNVGGIPFWLKDGKTGLLASPGDTGMLAQKIELLLQDSALATTLGENARQIALSEFNPERHAAALSKVYEKAMKVSSRSTYIN